MARLDSRELFPSGMEEYLDMYGWHFSRKLCEWAVSRMRKKNVRTGAEEKIPMTKKEDLEETFQRYGLDTAKFKAYDAVYVYHMAKSDFYGTSITDEQHLVAYVKDYLCDHDGYEEIAMTRFYADCIGRGEMPDWEECL